MYIIYINIYLSVYLSIYLSIYLSLCIYGMKEKKYSLYSFVNDPLYFIFY